MDTELKIWNELTPFEQMELFKNMDVLMDGETITIDNKEYNFAYREMDSTQEQFYICVTEM